MSGQSTSDTWLQDFMAKASPEQQKQMRECLRDDNFFLVGDLNELIAAIKQIEEKQSKH